VRLARGWKATKVSSALLSGLFIAALAAGMGLNALFASPSVLLDYYVPGAPGAPTSASAAPGNGSATVHWHIPLSSGNSPIVGYLVVPYNGLVPLAPQSFPGNTLFTRAITGLTNGKTYVFKVAAINSMGIGPQSPASNAVRVGAPGTPLVLKAIPGKNQVTLKLVAPATNNGFPINAYVVTPFLAGLPQTIRVSNSTSTTVVVGGLLNGHGYTFWVAARNKWGTGLVSPLSVAVLVAGAPGPPGSVKAARVAAGQVRVTFVAGANNGLAITSFKATCVSGKAGGVTKAQTGAVSPIKVTGLTVKKAYTCNVTATNARGTGTASKKSNTVIP
jgi:large repetitive protein